MNVQSLVFQRAYLNEGEDFNLGKGTKSPCIKQLKMLNCKREM